MIKTKSRELEIEDKIKKINSSLFSIQKQILIYKKL